MLKILLTLTNLLAFSALTACGTQDTHSSTHNPKNSQPQNKSAIDLHFNSDSSAEGARLQNAGDTLTYQTKVQVNNTDSLIVRFPFMLSDDEFRTQEWEKCGKIGVELCRTWKTRKPGRFYGFTANFDRIEFYINGELQTDAGINSNDKYIETPWESVHRVSQFQIFADPFSDPLKTSTMIYKTSLGKGQLKAEKRYFTNQGNIEAFLNVSALGMQSIDLKIVIRKTQDGSVFSLDTKQITTQQIDY